MPHAEPSYKRLHEAYLGSVGANGEIGYGFSEWDHAVIELADKNGSPKNSPRGIDFEYEEGFKDVGDYKVLWPTKSDKRYRPTDWLRRDCGPMGDRITNCSGWMWPMRWSGNWLTHRN